MYVDGEAYDMNEIMTIQTEKPAEDTKPPEDGNEDGKGDGSGGGSEDDKTKT